jgi:3-oxoacyl-[acyl-carrier-protein] synthase I
MTTSDAVIIGAGMVSPVGLSAPETAASVRAGVARFAPIQIFDREWEPFIAATAPDDGLPPLADGLLGLGLTTRESRMVRLAGRALRECLATVLPRAGRPGVVVALPEVATTRPLDGAAFVAWLALQAGGGFDVAQSDGSLRGRAGGIAAIHHAAAQIRNGNATVVLAGGVDTYRDPYVLGRFDAEQRVKTSSRADGFIPGEGAAFLALASTSTAQALGLVPLAGVSAAGMGFEPGHLYSEEPYRGDGLAGAIAALEESGGVTAPIREVYSSMNGEAYWAKEWGVGFLRNPQAFVPNHGMHHPADCMGDTGAAFGPLAAGLAAFGMRARYRGSPCLVYGSSDGGPRAAMVLTTAQAFDA